MTLHFLTGLLPLDLHVRAQVAGACYHLMAFKQWQGGPEHVSVNLLQEASVLSSFPSDLRVKFPNLTCAGLEFSEPIAKRHANSNLSRLYYR